MQKHHLFTPENNMLFSHVKRSPLLWLHNKSCLTQPKILNSEMVWHFIGVLINKTLHGCLEIQNFSSRVEKYLTCSLLSLLRTLEDKFCFSGLPCNALYIPQRKFER